MAQATSQKRVLIDRANRRVVVYTGIAAFVVIFCLVAGKSLFSQLLYQNRITSAKKQALSQLKTDETAISNLDSAYTAFVSTPQNVLGGNPSGAGPQDGDNAKIVLDALPSQYDFPALATSLEKLLNQQGVTIQSISGTDDEVAQSQQAASAKPTAQPIPFQVSASGNYQAVSSVLKTFEASIRPIEIQTLTLSGDDANLTLNVTAQTYYQPQMTFKIGSEVIK